MTLLVLEGGGRESAAAGAWLARGVEVASPDDPARWLAERRFHFAAIMADPAVTAGLDDALADTQPQAARSPLPDGEHLGDPERSEALLLDLGLVPSGRGNRGVRGGRRAHLEGSRRDAAHA
ncbi:MAG: hypothetical protein M5U31_15935 [Acidimicrobiia bacterium]|nr:hypothetical protein [Acidimicrobiia bacterium]